MYCWKCGAGVQVSFAFCISCGAKVKQANTLTTSLTKESEKCVPITSRKRVSTSKYVEGDPGMRDDLRQKRSHLAAFEQLQFAEKKKEERRGHFQWKKRPELDAGILKGADRPNTTPTFA